jgi:hypothetical protein
LEREREREREEKVADKGNSLSSSNSKFNGGVVTTEFRTRKSSEEQEGELIVACLLASFRDGDLLRRPAHS